jgi:hypothetical protein
MFSSKRTLRPPLRMLHIDWEDETTLVVDLSDGTTVIYSTEKLAERAPGRIRTVPVGPSGSPEATGIPIVAHEYLYLADVSQ